MKNESDNTAGSDKPAADKPAIGVVLCCHGTMGEGMRDAAEMVVGPQSRLAVVGIHPGEGGAEITAALERAVEEVDRGSGVLVLTDMAGGTPCNLVVSSLAGGGIEMVAGFNLPALINVLMSRGGGASLSDLAEAAVDYGRRHVVNRNEMLRACGAV
ncbi:MAG: PTS sugar transporter subunit IIA [Polyangia bacterium]